MNRILIYATIIILISGCCFAKVDCVSISGFGISILDKSDSTNLIFCSNKKYDLKDILFYSKNGYQIDTIKPYISYNNNSSFNNPHNCDSLVLIIPPSYTNKFYIKYSVADIDSFGFKQRVVKSDCCPNQTEFYDLEFRNKIIQLDSTYNYIIYK